ncbi:MAG: DUF1365 domain-containing protein [Burkholderiales bacterium]|nr:DUF1365 domain-containing protein [Burkholderiales bacterium]
MSGSPSNACLVEGVVMHKRSRPAAHAFRYSAFCLRLPLSRMHEIEGSGVRVNRRGLVSFHERDHGARDGSSLEAWARCLLARERVDCEGEIVLHAFPRMLGYVFNPVSFWVCHDAAGAVRAVLAEVNNTFGERHLYLLAHDDGRAIGNGEALRARKAFHVSPFCGVVGHYRFRFHFGADRFVARIDYFDGEAATPLLATSISGAARALPRRLPWQLLWRYRWFTLGVIARIHWQAVRLLLARVPYVRKPAPPAAGLTRGQ